MSRATKETCLDDLKLRILTTALEPGVMLDEASLARHYGLSRTPLREVLQRLAGAGYITIAEHRGAKVASMDIAVMRRFFQTAPMIYANISRLAAENRTSVQLDALQKAQDGFEACAAGSEAAATALANHRFHALIGEMAHNPYLTASLDRLLIDHARLSLTFYSPASPKDETRIEQASTQHQALIRAIAAQDPALAADLTLQHWDLSRDEMERFVRPDPLPFDVVSLKDRKHAL